MKILSLLLFPLLLFITPLTVRSQDTSEQAILRLQQEVTKREVIDRDQTIPADLKAQNRSVLDKRRAELATAIQARITALQKYLESLGNLATPEEKKYVQNSLQRLSSATTLADDVPVPSNGNNTSTLLDTNVSRSERSATTSPANGTNSVANARPVPRQVSGRVTVENEHFYQDENVKSALKAAYTAKGDVPLVGATIVAEQFTANFQRETRAKTITSDTGNYTLSLEDGDYIISATVGDFRTEEPITVTGGPVKKNLKLLVRPLGEYSRAIVGFEQAAASAASSTQKFFFDLTLSAPLPFGKADPYFGRPVRLWGTARVTSVPQQINSGVATFAAGFAQQVGNLKVNEIAQGIEFLAGTEIRLTKRMSLFGSFDGSTTNRFTISLIAGAGAITPVNPKTTLEIFKVFAGAPGLPPIPAGKDFIAFVSPDRDRFFRQYYGGVRLQTYYFNYWNPDIPLKRFPAVLDITFGQNEAVTGGRLRGGVLRLEGFYPLPYEGLKFINIFGTALMRLTRTQITNPLILEPAPTGTTVPAPNVFIQTVPQINRDYYRIGVGIDFMSLINRLRARQP